MDRTDYEERAEEAIRGFIDVKKPLGESIVDIAKRDSLNPEQIKRVVEMANTGAFLELFKQTAGDDRMVEFPTANAEDIIKRFYEPQSSTAGGASTMAGTFFDDVADENSPCCPPSEFNGSFVLKGASWEPRVKSAAAQKLAMRIDRVQEMLSDKIAAFYYDAEDVAVKLARCFASVYDRPKLAAFEADGLSLYGPSAVIAFNAVRETLREPCYKRLPDAGQVKTAAEFHLADSNTKEMQLLGDFLSKVSSLQQHQKAKTALEAEYAF